MTKKAILFLFSLFILGCATNKHELSNSLLGCVYDYQGNPVNSAKLKFTLDNKEIEVTTDIDGKFLIPQLSFGDYKVEVTADKCFPTNTSVNHYNSQNVLIIRINTYEDLIAKYKDLVLLEDLELAKTLMPQIEEIDPRDVSYQYIKSIYLIETEDFKAAETILKELELETLGDSNVYLLLADLYEYHINDNELAIKYLKKYLNREYTLKENNRLKELLNVEVN